VRDEGDATVRVVAADLISRARAGDGDAFRELTEPHRRELQVHCYRMLGSFQDAEDALQETLLAAWRGLGGFEGRASLRTWLYRIATNRCLNARRSASRRPAKEWDVPEVEPPEPTRFGEVVWLEPFPDALLEGAIDVPLGPEARYEQTEAISLAFVTALQVLPPRQLAVLILRDVLGFHASEVADMLDSTVESVTSALKRARAGLQRRRPPTAEQGPTPAPDSPAEDAIVATFVSAYESRGSGRSGRLAHRRCLRLHATDSPRIPGPRRRGPPVRQHLPLGPELRPGPDASQRSAGVRSLPTRPWRHPPRGRPHRPHPQRRPDLRHDPLRQQRAPMVRAAAIAPKPIASDDGELEFTSGPGTGKARQRAANPASRGSGGPARERSGG
jgi:RNA polymerase sigma-70 factor (TIGR02960 family)